jgi:hypothetical protein
MANLCRAALGRGRLREQLVDLGPERVAVQDQAGAARHRLDPALEHAERMDVAAIGPAFEDLDRTLLGVDDPVVGDTEGRVVAPGAG